MIRGPANGEAAGLVAGFGIWALAFLLLYGSHGAICSADMLGPAGARTTLIAIWIMAILAQGGLAIWFFRRLRAAPEPLRFIRLASLILSVAAIGATVWTGLPAISLKAC